MQFQILIKIDKMSYFIITECVSDLNSLLAQKFQSSIEMTSFSDPWMWESSVGASYRYMCAYT